MTFEVTTSIEVSDGVERDVWLEIDYDPGEEPSFRGHPDNWHPGAAGGARILSAHWVDTRQQLSIASLRAHFDEHDLTDLCEQQLRDDAESAAEARYEAWRDRDYDGH
jgi:hypothetical protein|tara:strand:- start:1186 stop:1509 length:324 start_codon:yes stop_codon:yes gene_type:complete